MAERTCADGFNMAVLIAIGVQAMNYIALLAWGTVGVFRLGGPDVPRILVGLLSRSEENPQGGHVERP